MLAPSGIFIPERPLLCASLSILLTLLAAGLLTIAGGAHATEPSRGLLRCMQLADDAERLACYDRVAQEGIYVGLACEGGANQLDPGMTPESLFGLEQKAQGGAELDAIAAQVVGGFRGWSGSTRFELDNGQVWLQLGSSRFDYSGQDREVVIRRAAFDSFMLSPEGFNRSVRVRRIE